MQTFSRMMAVAAAMTIALATGSAAQAQDGEAAPQVRATIAGTGLTPGEAGALLAQGGGADAAISRQTDPNRGPVTNMPLPRYVSLKGSEGNARRGPSLSHRIDWVFRHAGMPLRVVAEFGHWRRVEDRDGAGGWIHYSLLSGVRTALIEKDMAELHARPDADSDVVARAEAGAILKLGECTRDWCRLTGGGERGWLPKSEIWGVDPDETRD